MNTASLELSKELYEVSGWPLYDTEKTWRRFEAKRTGSTWFSPESDYTDGWKDPLDNRRATGTTHIIDHVAPAYDLGYLLRKLPHDDYEFIRMSDGWLIRGADPLNNGEGATPEDAAAKLAVELFKQGVLTRGGDE